MLVRRIYYYVVAAVGLVLVWFGAAETVSALLDWIFGTGSKVGAPARVGGAAGDGLSLLVVGVPVWALHWRTVQGIARRHDDAGLAERMSLPRRVYLYGAALAGALLILYYLARVVYRLLLSVMGDPYAGLLSVETADEIARAAISAALWTVHVLAIRTDSRMGTMGPETATDTFTGTSTDTSEEQDRLAARIAELENELAASAARAAALG